MRVIILDRDGVINHDSNHYITSPAQWRPIAGSLEAIARLNQAGYTVCVATNQSGLGRGYFDLDTLEAIHAKMLKLAAEQGGHIDHIFYCPHVPAAGCECRKPKPGLLLQAARYYRMNLADTFMVGDSPSDLDAARAAGARPIRVRTGKGQGLAKNFCPEIPAYKNLAAFVSDILV